MADLPSFSHSRLSALDDCPRRYAFRYIEKRPEAFQTADAYLGTLVHETLQWLYLEREEGRTPGADDAVARFRSAWSTRMTPFVRAVREDERMEHFVVSGEEMIRRHVLGTFAEDRLETLAIEPKISIQLTAGEGVQAAYVGFIDRLARDESGILHVIDYKTSRRVPDNIAAAGLQVRAYGLAVLEEHGGLEVDLRYEYVRHGRFLAERFPRARGLEVATALGERVRRALEVERTQQFPARPSPLCRWCGYRESCDASPFRAAPGTPAASVVERPSPSMAPPSEACPRCGSELRLRAGSRSELVTCLRYPECPHARETLPGDRERFAPAVAIKP